MSEKGAGTAILERLAAMSKEFAAINAKLDRLLAQGTSAPQNAGGRVAELREIEGARGDPKIRMVPRKWTGESFKGMRASQSSPDFLDVYADQLDWFASKNADENKAKWDRLDAARCRRWAVEIREGRVKQEATPEARPTPQSAGSGSWEGEDGSGGPWGESSGGNGW